MLLSLLQTRASSRLSVALAGVLLACVAFAWRLHGWTARGMAGEEAPAYQRQKAEAQTLRSATKTLKQADARGSANAQPATINWNDSDRDGIPDVVELASFNDRENFRRWFTAIAETQFYSLSDEWSVEQRDCAGLVRFSWREALRRHDRQWFQRMGREYEAIAPDVGAYTLESNPLGEKLFRAGAFKSGEKASEAAGAGFSEFATARSLKEFNSRFISRDRRLAEPGDLIFFFQPWAQKLPFHAMIFLGEARTSSEGARDWVVYHTGATRADAGVVKKVRLSVLEHHPDKRWRPVKSNPNFLGFYRLNILD